MFDDSWEGVSGEGKSFVMALMKVNPDSRIDVTGVLSHAWLAQHLSPRRSLASKALGAAFYEQLGAVVAGRKKMKQAMLKIRAKIVLRGLPPKGASRGLQSKSPVYDEKQRRAARQLQRRWRQQQGVRAGFTAEETRVADYARRSWGGVVSRRTGTS